ncbi:MAG: hypothetical protein LAC70_04385 [Methylovulum sp.]|nr:hypothetical protein [Methylovulum sp.]
MNIKQRLKIVESALMPVEREKRIIVFSVVDYDDETDLKGYKCNSLTATRNEGESLEQFSERAKAFFIENVSGIYGAFIFEPNYDR